VITKPKARIFLIESILLCFEKIKSKNLVRNTIIYSMFSFTLKKDDSPFIHPYSIHLFFIHPSFTLLQLRLLGDSPFRRVYLLSRSSFALGEE